MRSLLVKSRCQTINRNEEVVIAGDSTPPLILACCIPKGATIADKGEENILAIAFSHDDVIASENSDGVCDHIAFRHIIKGTHVNKGWRADFQTIRIPASRTHNIEPQLAFMCFSPAIDFASRSVKALGK